MLAVEERGHLPGPPPSDPPSTGVAPGRCLKAHYQQENPRGHFPPVPMQSALHNVHFFFGLLLKQVSLKAELVGFLLAVVSSHDTSIVYKAKGHLLTLVRFSRVSFSCDKKLKIDICSHQRDPLN